VKVLFVLPAYYPALDFGGPIPVAQDSARRLADRGHEVTIWTTNLLTRSTKMGSKTEEREVDGIRTVYMNSVGRYRWVGIAPDVFGYLRRELADYDVIHLYGYREFLTLAVAMYARRIGKPYVLQALGTTARMNRSMGKKLIYDAALGTSILKNAATLIAKSHLENQQYLEAGARPEKITLLPNGIELPEEAMTVEPGSFRRANNIGDDETLVLFLGRIDPIKGLDILLPAFANVRNRARLAIVGPDEGKRQGYEDFAARIGLGDSIIFVGPLYAEEKWAAYRDADIYVLPSVFENFPRTILEAMGCGTPVILTDRCGIASQIEGRAGLVVPYDEKSFSDALARLIDDRELRAELSESGRRLVSVEFSWEPLITRLENMYRDSMIKTRRSNTVG